jgi:hypothetical protein
MIETTDRQGRRVLLILIDGAGRWAGCYPDTLWSGGWFNLP